MNVLNLVLFALLNIFSNAAIPPKLPEYLYELCNVPSLNCLTGWDLLDGQCLNHQNCTTMVAFQNNTGLSYTFWTMTRLTSDVAYVALGFSTDQKMGDDGVVECIQEKKGEPPKVYLSYNDKGRGGPVRLGVDTTNNITGINGIADDDYLYCSYVLPNQLDFGSFNISLEGDQEYYVFGVAGGAKMDGQNVIGAGYHSASKLISDKTYFKENGDNSGSRLSAYFFLISTLLLLIIKI